MAKILVTSRAFLASRLALGAVLVAATCGAAGPADAGMFARGPMQFNRAPMQMGSPAWTRLHTEAPSQFHAPIGGFANVGRVGPASGRFQSFNGPAAGPAGAQFGRLPTTNKSFIDPTRNSSQAHQTRNSTQARNTQMSTNAVQGRNCYLNAILAGLCQGR